jgi:CheY-like chemotaxis protein
VLEVLRFEESARLAVAGGSAIRFRDEAIPLSSFAQLLGAPPCEARWTLVLQVGSRRWGLAVSALLGEQEILRRPVDALVSRFEHVAASATLDDGRLVLLLSPPVLFRRRDVPGAPPPPSPAPTTRRRQRVLVVDDSLTVCDLVSELLAEAGFEVRSAVHGQAALVTMQDWMPDLTLVDIDMPVMNGFELLQRVRARWQHLPVLMLTTRGSPDDRRRAASLGANAYLVKSQFEESNLIETIRRFLGAPPP